MAETKQVTPETSVSIEVTIRFELPAADVWPDGLPDEATAADVIDAVEETGSLLNFIREWDADVFGAEVTAGLNGQTANGRLR